MLMTGAISGSYFVTECLECGEVLDVISLAEARAIMALAEPTYCFGCNEKLQRKQYNDMLLPSDTEDVIIRSDLTFEVRISVTGVSGTMADADLHNFA